MALLYTIKGYIVWQYCYNIPTLYSQRPTIDHSPLVVLNQSRKTKMHMTLSKPCKRFKCRRIEWKLCQLTLLGKGPNCPYYIYQLLRMLWLVNFAGRIILYGPLKLKLFLLPWLFLIYHHVLTFIASESLKHPFTLNCILL